MTESTILYDAECGIDELPRHLRNLAAFGGGTLTLMPDLSLQLARRVEAETVLTFTVERSPSWFDWTFWMAVLGTACMDLIEGPTSIIASYIRGLLQ